MPILEFQGQYRFLSNFYPASIILDDGITYPTSEHAYQAWKSPDLAVRRRVAAEPTPGGAKRIGKTLATSIPLWDSVKYAVMFYIVTEKFRQNMTLAQWLIATGDEFLVEGNRWGDVYWGVDLRRSDAPGQNKLGEILMRVRNVAPRWW